MSYDTNVYYNPSKSGLSCVDELNEPGLCYEYNTLVVWQHDASGRIFWARDSGCSCPTPFENYFFRGPDDTNLDEVKQDNFYTFESDVDSFPVEMSERQALLKLVSDLLNK